MDFFKGRFIGGTNLGGLEGMKADALTISRELQVLKKGEQPAFTIKYILADGDPIKEKILFYKKYDFFSQKILYTIRFFDESTVRNELIYKTEDFSVLKQIVESFFKSNKIYDLDNWTTKEEEVQKKEIFQEVILKEIIEETEYTYNKIILTNEPCTVYASKIGGIPYMPIGAKYPIGKTTKESLYLLAQINFEEMPPLGDFPRKGMLQFFLGTDDLYGIDYEEPTKQDNFRIIYYETVDYDAEQGIIPELNKVEEGEGYRPILSDSEYRISFEQKTRGITSNHWKFEELLREKCKKNLDININSLQGLFDNISDELYERLSDDGHCIGGEAKFIQEDPRKYMDRHKSKEVLLLQLDSEWNEKLDINITWGDMGCGNFFITSSDLKNKRFDSVLYNWDCH